MKHTPQRTCIVCRQKLAKGQLLRVVRTPEQAIRLDRTGKANGRGAYFCSVERCVDKGLQAGFLSRVLKCTVTPTDVAQLKQAVADVVLAS